MSPCRFTNKLEGQRVLLIGGTGGVGTSVAQALIEFGATVILSSSRESKIKEVFALITSDYPEAKDCISGYACDLAGPDVEANIEKLFQQVGNVNHIIYMAGDRLPTTPLEDVTLGKWQKSTQVRTIASLLVVKVGIKYLKKDRSSSITFTGGSISEQPIPGGWSMLALIGAGINGLARQLAFDLAPIRVNVVAPGVIDTDLWAGLGEECARKFKANHESKMLTGKIGQPDDLAEAYLYSIRDLNATGIILHSNSGAFLV